MSGRGWRLTATGQPRPGTPLVRPESTRSTMAVMPSDDFATRIRIASRSCPDAVSGQVFRSPAQAFADLARSCAELDIEEWDFYGEFGPVGRLESELVELFGVEGAAFFPSGIMAQEGAPRGD